VRYRSRRRWARKSPACSSSKVDLIRSIGADHVIDYTKEDFAIEEHRYDLIFDIAGNGPLFHLRRALTAREHL
jgi:NADPH:quinone reductase-like Zn-dependent oxidoreductase